MDHDKSSKSEVDGSGDKDRTDGEGDEVPQKVVSVEGIPAQEHPGDVSKRFCDQAEAHGNHEYPRLVPNPQVQLCDCEDGQNSKEDGISSHSRPVPNITPISDRACVQGADEPFHVTFGGRHFGRGLSRCVVEDGVAELVGVEVEVEYLYIAPF